MEELLSKSFIQELKIDGTYNDASFAREYESEWSGDVENAFFSSEKFDKHRRNHLFSCKFHFYVSSHFTFMFPPISLKVSTWKQGVK